MSIIRFYSSSIFFHLSIVFLVFVLRIRPSIAFFFSSGGGCSCPVCPPPQPAVSCCCGGGDTNANGNCGGGCGGSCSGGAGGGGGCAAGAGGTNGGGGCGATTAGCDGGGGCSFQNGGGCTDANGAGIGTGQFGGAGAVPCISQPSLPSPSASSSCPPQQNCAPANCAPSNPIGCSSAQSAHPNCGGTQQNGDNCATAPAAECGDSGGTASEGGGCAQQPMAPHTENCGGPPCPSHSSAPASSHSSNCQPIEICTPSHSPPSSGNSMCQPICAPHSAPVAVQPSAGAGGTYANGLAQPPMPSPNQPPLVPSYPPEPVGSPFETNNINNFAGGYTHSNSHQQNAGGAEPPSSFTTQQQPQFPQPIAPLPVQPPPPAESDNQSDRESSSEGIAGGGYRDTGLNNGGKEGGLSLLSSKLIRVGGSSSTTTTKPSKMDWDLYEEKLPDMLADYETETSIASGRVSVGTKSTIKAFVPTMTPTATAPSTFVPPTAATTTFYAVRTNSHRLTPIVWASQGIRTTKATGSSSRTSSTTSATTTTTTAARTTTTATTTTAIMPKMAPTTAADEFTENNDDLLSDDYSENSFKKVQASVRNRNGEKRTSFGTAPLSASSPSPTPAATAEEDPKCSSETLRAIMQENIVLSPTISKQLIFSAGRLAFGQSIDVICSKNKFSYTVVSSKVFCEASNGPVTCFSFLQP